MKIKIVKFHPKYARETSKVICDTYSKFCLKDATKKGAEEYIRQSNYKEDPQLFLKRFKRMAISYVAFCDNKLVGVIIGRKNRVINLFVLENYHKKGIDKALLEKFEEEVKKLKSKFIKINASLYAVSFYKSQGYKKTTGVRNFHENKVQPMKKIFDQGDFGVKTFKKYFILV